MYEITQVYFKLSENIQQCILVMLEYFKALHYFLGYLDILH